MTIRTGRLHRICKRCGNTFKPTGKSNYICKKCNKNIKGPSPWLDEIYKQQKKVKLNHNKVYKCKSVYKSMELKTIKVSLKNWKKLMRWKIDLECKNLDEVVERILKIIPVNKLK